MKEKKRKEKTWLYMYIKSILQHAGLETINWKHVTLPYMGPETAFLIHGLEIKPSSWRIWGREGEPRPEGEPLPCALKRLCGLSLQCKEVKKELTCHLPPTFPISPGKCQTDVLKGWKNEMKGTFRIYRAENQRPVEIRTLMSTKLAINAFLLFFSP